ncbi:VanZ family protein [Alloacidobacterium dinghuense]|uniref:VanZ family protein n=1 Tax=Alloacidobacterium dinghuense TaxID=2763107 RepID=A0A7G8BN03_9BACT|nr:VanZ family protein [Alloacidobacterium dinghuense]QNI33923.1 VanZ family protein [Alloacidobacterium dinghuense]
MPSRRLNLFLHWIPAMIGIVVILIESTATMSAENTSRWLLPLWVKLFGPITPEHWAEVHHYIRKTGHFVGYGLVSLGFFEGWRATFSERLRQHGAIFALVAPLALVSTLALAGWDEWHQSFLPGRTSKLSDVGLDFSGAVVAHVILLLVLVIVWRLRARSKPSTRRARPVSSQV